MEPGAGERGMIGEQGCVCVHLRVQLGVAVHLSLARGGEGFSQSCPRCHYLARFRGPLPAEPAGPARTCGWQGSVRVLATFSRAHWAGGSSVRGHGWARQAEPVHLR